MEKTILIRLFKVILLVLLGIGIGYVFAGFLQQDDVVMNQTRFIYKLMFIYGPLIALPIIYAFLIYAFLFASKEFIKSTLFTGIVLVLILMVLFPVYELVKNTFGVKEDKYAKRFHPYLQLMPPQVDAQNYQSSNYNIFCLGGSTTQYTNSEGMGWPAMLEQSLRVGLKTDSIDVYNLGMQWYTTQHSLINYEVNIKHYRHDVLIVMHAINDLLHNADFSSFSKGAFREDYGHFYGPVKNAFKKPGSLVRSIAGSFGQYWYAEPTVFVDQKEYPGLESFERNLISLIEVANLKGVKVVLMSQPNILHADLSDEIKSKCQMINSEAVGSGKKWTYESGITGMEKYNQLVRTLANEQKVVLVDLESVVPKTLEYFTDEVHYTDAAYPLIKAEIARVLMEEKLINSTNNGK
ncbi:SGNH/GDSL hydrolase family protein [Carboxylicivirga linearis]|uniref:SGNH hydrolase-type esterase domain-containing protein n=1 Tax=Carboxylicivirga linearis TaxID=1628157 RepID=A0ABS5JXB4_9BACT|nr:SGNH/GDSL hydrolase family protein [Carboxylicivirga linearis]MBS2099091.1 hypothetical protein [Carboxylicivirga linearis]